jgi:hypothetical protein
MRVVLIATLASDVIVDGITSQIQSPLKLIVPVLVEVATIAALLIWAKSRTGYLQATCLIFALSAHLIAFVDIWLRTDMVYSHYVIILQWIAGCQIAVCYDTINRIGERAGNGCAAFIRSTGLGVAHACLQTDSHPSPHDNLP